jgi:hypothetical protein
MKVKALWVGAVVPNDGVGAIETAHDLIDIGRLGRAHLPRSVLGLDDDRREIVG